MRRFLNMGIGGYTALILLSCVLAQAGILGNFNAAYILASLAVCAAGAGAAYGLETVCPGGPVHFLVSAVAGAVMASGVYMPLGWFSPGLGSFLLLLGMSAAVCAAAGAMLAVQGRAEEQLINEGLRGSKGDENL